METKDLNPKESLLLGAGLDVLHFESKEWLSKINFWKDEVQFFDNILKKTTTLDINREAYNNLLIGLDTIHRNLFDDLENDIVEHERLLSDLEQKSKGLSDSEYRQKHHKFNMRINAFENDFKAFKKIIFEHVKSSKI